LSNPASKTDQGFRNRFKYGTIAAALLIIAAAFIFFNLKTRHKTGPVDQIAPSPFSSSKGIILTLSDGSIINIDSMNKPITQGNVLLKMNGDELTYIPVANTPKEEGFNTIRTLCGKQFKVVFPDGSKVWLNAGSSIHYPTSFDKYRMVDITGEAFFEVVPVIDPAFPDNKVPFYVTVNGMEISVKGTRFNVKAYDNDNEVRTTLLEGSIKVKKRNQIGLLEPGQQAVLSKGILTINTAFNEEEVLAWRKNLFVFQNSAIEPLMHQIARWYNVTVVYEDVIMDNFTATVPRNIPLEQLLKILELSNPVHFRLEDNMVIVSK
jgi:ferric-dicitrate binding protein FerR (iron transport regulator)